MGEQRETLDRRAIDDTRTHRTPTTLAKSAGSSGPPALMVLVTACLLVFGLVAEVEARNVLRPCDNSLADKVEVLGPEEESVTFVVGTDGKCLCAANQAEVIDFSKRMDELVDLAKQRRRDRLKHGNDFPRAPEISKLSDFWAKTVGPHHDFERTDARNDLLKALGIETATATFSVTPPPGGAVAQGSAVCWKLEDLGKYFKNVGDLM